VPVRAIYIFNRTDGTDMTDQILKRARAGETLSVDELVALLSITDKDELQALFDCAYFLKEQYVGKVAYFRGIIECSNMCIKDCFYCGIRRSNEKVERFLMSEDEIFKEAMWAYEAEYGSCVIQSGERQDEEYLAMIERVVRRIASYTNGEFGITLSLGEQAEDTYRRWKMAGAHRYLLRIETTNPALYARIHPADHSLAVRMECLAALRRCGYQVGTGVMIGLPGQTNRDLANDIVFLRNIDIDMVGMGPYIPHSNTPMGREMQPYTEKQSRDALQLGLKMIATTRIVLKDINIAAATALQALEHNGREQGLRCGANVIMPNITETEYRPKYQLYDNKPCLDENSSMCRGCLTGRINGIGESIGFNQRGDSPHFRKRTAAE
jgi:biotin synthase